MSLPREVLLELMALADGELDGEDKQRAERLVAQDARAREVFEAMRAPVLRDWLGEAMRERAQAADGIADAVVSRLQPSVAPRLAAAAAGAAAAPGAARRGTAGVAAGASSGRRAPPRAAVAATAVTLLALAAAVALYVRSTAQGPGAAPAARAVGPVAPAAPPVAVASNDREGSPAAPGVVVDDIDSPSRDVSIFQIPAMANAATSSVVVWIDDDPGAR